MLNEAPEWVKVKIAAVTGVTVPWLAELFVKAGPVLDAAIKLGQVGVAAVTILYICKKIKFFKKSKDE